MNPEETLEETAGRELQEKTGIKDYLLEQLYTFGENGYGETGKVVSVTYYVLVPEKDILGLVMVRRGELESIPVEELPILTPKQKTMIRVGVERIKSKLGYSSIAVGLLPKEFRLSELQKIYEVILGEKIDKRNFRKKMLSLELLEKIEGKMIKEGYRPAALYKFKTKKIVIFG